MTARRRTSTYSVLWRMDTVTLEALRRDHFEAALDILDSAPHRAEEALAHLVKAGSGEETQEILEVGLAANPLNTSSSLFCSRFPRKKQEHT
jgi:hypothetical protein